MHNHVLSAFGIISFTLISTSSYGMDAAAMLSEESKGAVAEAQKPVALTWPPLFYDEAWVGKATRCLRDAKGIAELRERAGSLRKDDPAVEALPLEERITLDWVNALAYSEKELLPLPYEKWTLLHLKILATCLTRLTCSEAGSLRKHEHRVARTPADKKEAKKLKRMLENGNKKLSGSEREFLKAHTITFPSPVAIERLITEALAVTQKELCITREESDPITRKMAILAVAVKIHFLIASLAPFQGGIQGDDCNLRVGRLVMTIILHQHGIGRPFYADRLRLNRVLFDCLKEQKETKLLELTWELIQHAEKIRHNGESLEHDPMVETILNQLLKPGANGEAPMLDFANDPACAPLLKYFATAVLCASCTKKQENVAFKVCSRC